MDKILEIGQAEVASSAALKWDELSIMVEKKSMKCYRKSYFVSMIKSGKDLDQCGRLAAAGMLFNKMRYELNKHSSSEKIKLENLCLDFGRVGLSIASNAYDELNIAYNNFNKQLPRQEQTFFSVKIKEVEKSYQEFKQHLNSRRQLRVQGRQSSLPSIRSLRIQLYNSIFNNIVSIKTSEPKKWDIKIQEGTGCYNALFNAREIADLISKTDRNWIEDFLDHYKSYKSFLRLF